MTLSAAPEILNLFHALDSQDGLEKKIPILQNWCLVYPEIAEIRIFAQDIHEADFSPEDFSFSPGIPLALTASSPLPPFVKNRPDWQTGALFYPLGSRGVLLLKTACPLKLLTDRKTELGLIASKLKDLLDLEAFRRQSVSRPPAPEVGKDKKKKTGEPVPGEPDQGLRTFLEHLKMPYYVCQLSGKVTYINGPFTHAFGFAGPQDVNKAVEGFFNPVERSLELKTLSQHGFAEGFPLTVTHASGRTMKVRDFAVLHDGCVTGVLFDVTEYVSVNEEMKEALRIQELLNDKIITSAMILEKTQTTSIRALARLAEYRDHETGGHLQRICEYTKLLTREVYRRQPFEFQISDQYVQDIYLSSMLHDIGKVAVPDAILRKRGDLNCDERETMKKHTEWGWQILSQADRELGEESFLTLASQIALAHHERWDGQGYPRGLAGSDIPLSARIEAVADVYDALTSDRPYKKAWTHGEALEEIVRLRGLQFDPVLVDIFIDIHEMFDDIRIRYRSQEEPL